MSMRAALSVPSHGFTLIELTVSMTLLSVVLTLLFSALWFAARTWDAAALRRDTAHTSALIQGVLARQLRQTRPLFETDTHGQRVVAFAGDSDRITYIAPLSRRDDVLYVNTLYLDATSRGGVLRLHYTPLRPGTRTTDTEWNSNQDGASVDLMTQMDRLAIAYYGSPENGIKPHWQSQWHNPRALPDRIHIRIGTTAPGTRPWEDLLVCPGGGAACLMPVAVPRTLRSVHAGGIPHGG